MTDLIPTRNQTTELAHREAIGQAANRAAAAGQFADYRGRKAANTIRRQDADLALFSEFLDAAGITPGDLATDPEAWRGITWGLVKAFTAWQLQQGYATSSVNMRLSTCKVYAKMAMQAGALAPSEYAQIRALEGYRLGEAKHIDEERQAAGIPTRTGRKKAEWVGISPDQAKQLKKQPNTPQGRRDALLMCLLLDHGLRCGEVAGLQVTDFHLDTGLLIFYRPKVHKTQTHRLTPAALAAAKAYSGDAPAIGALLRGSRKGKGSRKGENGGGVLTGAGMSEQSITERVRVLGEAVGLEGLSAHDCRHYGATQAARNHTPVDRLMSWGGWTSPAMALRYVETAKIANEGVNLGSD